MTSFSVVFIKCYSYKLKAFLHLVLLSIKLDYAFHSLISIVFKFNNQIRKFKYILLKFLFSVVGVINFNFGFEADGLA